MTTYKLNQVGDYAQQFVDGVATGVWAHTEYNQAYLAWLAEGNEPLPADSVTVELTASPNETTQ
jgi:hypothetical protein